MKALLKPQYLIFTQTLPAIVLFLLIYEQYSIIHTLLDKDEISLWNSFGLSLAILTSLNIGIAIYLIIKRQSIPVFYAAINLLLHIAFMYLYFNFMERFISWNIPTWMLSGNLYFLVPTFLMPAIAHSLFTLVLHSISEIEQEKVHKSFLISLMIPVAIFIVLLLIKPLRFNIFDDLSPHIFICLSIIIVLFFFYFLIRAFTIITLKRSSQLEKYQLFWEIPIAVILPIIGLLVNNGILFKESIDDFAGIFGDFSNIWFYVIAVLNGIIICLPQTDNKLYRILLFAGKSITFSYTIYFALVFLPFLPLSLFAVIAFGIGFLMLTPLALFIIHTGDISTDFSYLKQFYSPKILTIIFIAGFCVIPIGIHLSFASDKSTLNKTLTYLYSPDYSKEYKIDKVSLRKTIHSINSNGNSRMAFSGNDIPYISTYFKWLVLDNLTLPRNKVNDIEQIFFDQEISPTFEIAATEPDSVKLTGITYNSTFDEIQKVWKSEVNLELTNHTKNRAFSEYMTIIDLPKGCWISDYYLFVGDKKEFGILAEKKAAMWIFAQNLNTNRDPGILYYLSGNKVALRVFPFLENEIRKTGFELIHKEPFQLTIDKNIVQLGDSTKKYLGNTETSNVAYISSEQKKLLKPVQREPYFHFIVDASAKKKESQQDYIQRIELLCDSFPAIAKNAKISFTNSYVQNIPLNSDWKQKYAEQEFDGGFFLDRAIKKALFDAYKTQSYPIIILVADGLKNAVLDKSYADLKFTFPESDYFYHLVSAYRLETHSLIHQPKEELENQPEISFYKTVLEYTTDNKQFYLPDNNEPDIVIKKDIFKPAKEDISEKNFHTAMDLQGMWMSQTLHPETSDQGWKNLIEYSFQSKIMTPVTSYIVVENEAQKAMLMKKQKDVLLANKALDIDDSTIAMSEPKLWILLVLISIFIAYQNRRKLLFRV